MKKPNIFTHNKSRTLFGCRIQQSWQSLYVIEKMLSNYKPDVIVELGTGCGLLSLYLCMYGKLQGGVKIFTTDIKEAKYSDAFHSIQGVDIVDLNIDIYADSTIKTMTDNLNNGQRSLLFCDGLDPKATEVNLFSKHLKKGIVVLAHDYVTNPDKKARWCFTDEQIDWTLVEPYEPYHSLSKEYDARLGCFVKI